MTQYTDLDEVARRPLRYWNIDGLPELGMGVLWMIWGGAMLLGNALPKGQLARGYWMVVPVLLVASGVLLNRVTKRLKERLTYPRTGYVALREPGRVAHMAAAAIAAVSAAGLAALIRVGKALEWEQAVASAPAFLIALALAGAAIRSRAPHLGWLAAFSLLLGAALYVTHAGYEGLNWTLIGVGGASAALGSVRLRRFLRAHPRPLEASA